LTKSSIKEPRANEVRIQTLFDLHPLNTPQSATNCKMKHLTCSILLVFLATTSCRSAPSISDGITYFDQVYLIQGAEESLSRTYRQASDNDEDDGSTFRQLLLQIRQLAAATAINYGCRVDTSSTQFTQKFLTAYTIIAPTTDEDETLLTTAARIAALVVTDLDCVGRVTYTSPEFQDNFRAAYASQVLEAGDGNEVTRKIAVLMMEKYKCQKVNANDRKFIVKFLSTFADTVDYAKTRTFPDEGTELTRFHIAQLIRKYNCGNPDPEDEEFKSNFFIARLTVALS